MTDPDVTITGVPARAAMRAEATAPLAALGSWGVATARGPNRPENDDAFGHLGSSLFVIADGMGGHAGGRLAAATAVQALLSSVGSVGLGRWDELFDRIAGQVRTATRARGFDRAGTTLCVLRLLDGVVTIAHVGDTRVYRLRGGELTGLTRDHHVANALADAGIDPRRHPGAGSHALTRHLGAADGNAVPDVTSLVPQVGDQLIMLTDGVHKPLDEASIIDALARTPDVAAALLVERAGEAGGRDDATAVVLSLSEALR